jgi:hypothetical protein
MKEVSQTTQFSRDVKRLLKRGKDLSKLQDVVRLRSCSDIVCRPRAARSPMADCSTSWSSV